MRTHREVNDLKIAGTILDRRRKISDKERNDIIVDYAFGMKPKDIAEKYNINRCQIYRYVNYQAYLDNNCKYSRKYRIKADRDELYRKDIESHKKTFEYKNKLLDVMINYKN